MPFTYKSLIHLKHVIFSFDFSNHYTGERVTDPCGPQIPIKMERVRGMWGESERKEVVVVAPHRHPMLAPGSRRLMSQGWGRGECFKGVTWVVLIIQRGAEF